MAETFAEALTSRREALSIKTQRDLQALLARAGCRVSLTTISSWHKGHSAPVRERLTALLDVLHLSGKERARWCLMAVQVGERRVAA